MLKIQVLLLAIALCVVCVHSSCYEVTGTDTGLRIRESPSLDSRVVSVIPDGTRVESTGDADVNAHGYTWRKIAWGDITGWVAIDYLKACAADDDDGSDPFGGIPEQDILTGNYEPSQHPRFFRPVNSWPTLKNPHGQYLRVAVGNALVKMLAAFRKDFPRIDVPVLSALRNLDSQTSIWNNQYSRLDGDPLTRCRHILLYSSMPGTSRHHWGTDVDLLSLEPEDFEDGRGLIFYKWLLANADKYGFRQPYCPGRTQGYNIEQWHWSFYNISIPLLAGWNKHFRNDLPAWTSKVNFSGVRECNFLAPTYVNQINPRLNPRNFTSPYVHESFEAILESFESRDEDFVLAKPDLAIPASH